MDLKTGFARIGDEYGLCGISDRDREDITVFYPFGHLSLKPLQNQASWGAQMYTSAASKEVMCSTKFRKRSDILSTRTSTSERRDT